MHASRSLAVAIVASAFVVGCKGESARTDSTKTGTTTTTTATTGGASGCPGDNAGLTLPSGFCATVFADSLGEPRHVVVSSDGVVYTTLQKPKSPEAKLAGAKPPKGGAVAVLRDANNDGKADTVAYIPGTGNTGVALYNDHLYVDEGERIVRYARKAGDVVPGGQAETIVSGIPMQPGHVSRNFAIAGDGTLYVNVGSATNACQVKDRTAHSPGKNPCPELATRAGIWKFDANKTNQHFSAGVRWATGIRNAMGLSIAPDGKVWTTQHGRDNLADNWGFDTKYSADNPAEELMQVNQGDDFGWPYCYYAQDQKKLVLAPEYGGDGKKTAQCDQKKAPVAVFGGHWAPMSTLWYTGSMLPDKYKNGVFIAFHGSWNRAPEPQAGYRVVFQPLSGGSRSGDPEDFATGFPAPGQLQPDAASHRPAGLAQGPDGSIYITDDKGGRVYRVTYKK